jgi:hypothetical protein
MPINSEFTALMARVRAPSMERYYQSFGSKTIFAIWYLLTTSVSNDDFPLIIFAVCADFSPQMFLHIRMILDVVPQKYCFRK